MFIAYCGICGLYVVMQIINISHLTYNSFEVVDFTNQYFEVDQVIRSIFFNGSHSCTTVECGLKLTKKFVRCKRLQNILTKQ